MRFFKSIKFRLTVWYLIVILVLLLVFGGAAYLILAKSLYQNLDDSLMARATELQIRIQAEGGRTIFVERLNELVLIYNSDGLLLGRFGPNVQLTNIDSVISQALAGESFFVTAATADGQAVRFYIAPFNIGPNAHYAIAVGQPADEIGDILGTFRYTLAASGLAVLALAAVSGVLLAGRVLKPVDRITRTAQDIGGHDLSRRVKVHGDDELGRLALTLNAMIGRLETAFNRQRQFTADASHELRTPLAVVQAESTLALSKERSEAEYRKSLELIAQEAGYMSAMIGKLLFLARSDAGKEPLSLEDINLQELIAELISNMEVLARDKGVEIRPGPVENLTIRGDRVKVRQVFINILENAVRYTPSGGQITCSITRRDKMAEVAVKDTGIGISAEHLPYIFERFYRVDKARSRADGGVGLGLAIARYITEVHGGGIEVQSEPGKGATFIVLLPIEKVREVRS